MSGPNEEFDDLLRRLVTGELDPASSEGRAALERHPKLLEAHEESMETLALLDAAGEYARGLARDVEERESAPGDERVEATLRGEVSRRGRPGRPRLARPMAWAAAALLLVMAGFALWPSGDGSGGTRMLGGGITGMEPSGAGAVFESFHWEYALPAGGWFEVTVYAEDGAQLERSGELTEPAWPVGAATSATWPDRIRWEVRAFDAGGRPEGSGSATASRD